MKVLIYRITILSLFCFTAACSSTQKSQESLSFATENFSGVVPCPDCKGISTELILKRKIPEGTPSGFFLHEIKIDAPGGERVNTSWGEWSQKDNINSSTEVIYILHPEIGDPRYYRSGSDGRLQVVDSHGEPVNNEDGIPVALNRVIPGVDIN
ncbi:copper resistance protein NlpE N-terminal domain-containing protein [Marinobacterium lutimaris]|uniref:copper resistance protein NlpE N-terminal domain-containing protein n=1 Tax=Marinobacterium lutimaris TaxID=568106 RepID=UPI001359479D|nr:copper resistance protein NlpE N-terminal domain-containing protein [Marinobacterium lutimaris]